MKFQLCLFKTLGFVSIIVLAGVSSSVAATITPNDTTDVLLSGDGLCTLREVIINANEDTAIYSDCTAGSGSDVINLTAGETYSLTIQNAGATATYSGPDEDNSLTGDLDITSDLEITATTSGTSTIANLCGIVCMEKKRQS